LFVGTPLYPLYLRALGARIGKGVAILSAHVPVCTDLLRIGDGTLIRKDDTFNCYRASAGGIQTGPVKWVSNVLVGDHALFDIDTGMEDNSGLAPGSFLHRFQTVPAGRTRHGFRPGTPDTTLLRAGGHQTRHVTHVHGPFAPPADQQGPCIR
jgi:non-ribosomal peptide synthetase-like protein